MGYAIQKFKEELWWDGSVWGPESGRKMHQLRDLPDGIDGYALPDYFDWEKPANLFFPLHYLGLKQPDGGRFIYAEVVPIKEPPKDHTEEYPADWPPEEPLVMTEYCDKHFQSEAYKGLEECPCCMKEEMEKMRLTNVFWKQKLRSVQAMISTFLEEE